MSQDVGVAAAFLPKSLATQGARVRLFAGMNPLMNGKSFFTLIGLAARIARMRPLYRVTPLMPVQEKGFIGSGN